PHALERNVLDCTDRPIVAGLSTNTKALIEYAIKNPTTSEPLTSLDEISQFHNAYLTYTLMRSGVEGRQEYTIEVKRTITVSNTFNCTWTLANVGKVLGKASLVQAYAVPSNIASLN